MNINSSTPSTQHILRYSPEEFAEKGTQIYQQTVLPTLGIEADGKIVEIGRASCRERV